jgi:hypothetical protein
METKEFLRLLRQGYGLFVAKICFKPEAAAAVVVVTGPINLPQRHGYRRRWWTISENHATRAPRS